jgi:hypothetical protein
MRSRRALLALFALSAPRVIVDTGQSADGSPGTYLGNLDAGKIDNNEIPPTIQEGRFSTFDRIDSPLHAI